MYILELSFYFDFYFLRCFGMQMQSQETVWLCGVAHQMHVATPHDG